MRTPPTKSQAKRRPKRQQRRPRLRDRVTIVQAPDWYNGRIRTTTRPTAGLVLSTSTQTGRPIKRYKRSRLQTIDTGPQIGAINAPGYTAVTVHCPDNKPGRDARDYLCDKYGAVCLIADGLPFACRMPIDVFRQAAERVKSIGRYRCLAVTTDGRPYECQVATLAIMLQHD